MRLPAPARRLAFACAAAAVSAIVLSGCGEHTGSGDEEPDATAWQDLDACTLLTDAQVADALATGETFEATPDTSDPSRPACTWSVQQYGAEVTVLLWDPPIPDALTEDRPEVAVGDHTGYVQGSNASQCLLQVETDDYWVSVDLDADVSAESPDFCARNAAPVAELVLAAAQSGV